MFVKRLCLILLPAVFLLGACSLFGGGGAEPSPEASADPDEPVLTKRNITLTVWTEPGAGEDFIRQAATVFKEKYPNITIQVTPLESSDILRRVRAESAPGGCADLFIVPHTEIRQLAGAWLILPARDQVKTKNTVFPACAQAATVNGAVYGYPVSSETVALFYNKRLIPESEIPSTWEELEAFAKAFGGERGFVMPVGSAHYDASFLAVRNNRPFGPDGENMSAANINNSSVFEGMALLKSLRDIIGLPSEELTPGAVETMFASGRAAVCIAGPWSISRFSGAGIDFGVAPLPTLVGEERFSSMAFARVMTVSAHSEWPDEASAFAALLLTEEMQKLRLELTGELPSVSISVRSPAYANGFISQMEGAFAAPTIPETAAYWAGFSEAVSRIWDGGDVQEALTNAEIAFYTAS